MGLGGAEGQGKEEGVEEGPCRACGVSCAGTQLSFRFKGCVPGAGGMGPREQPLLATEVT